MRVLLLGKVKNLERRTEEDVACSDLVRYLRAALLHHTGGNSFGLKTAAGTKTLQSRQTDPEEPDIVTDDPRRRKMERKRREQQSSDKD